MRFLSAFIVLVLTAVCRVQAGCFPCNKPDVGGCLEVAKSLETNNPNGVLQVRAREDRMVGMRGNCYVYAKNNDFADQGIVRRSIAQGLRSAIDQCGGGQQCGTQNVGYFEIRFDKS
ncbi:hypothetical protein BC940DRAFT_300315 [Gongronella butleri]|nr:hypothetical protein BC940DRAFT_300315 [Gongronella butleri]